MKSSGIMYIEQKAGSILGPSRIGRVTFSKTGRTIYYKGQQFRSLKGAGFKSNYYDVETGDDYWISGPRADGADGLYGGSADAIDDDVCDEYWREMRHQGATAKEDRITRGPTKRGWTPPKFREVTVGLSPPARVGQPWRSPENENPRHHSSLRKEGRAHV